MRYLLVLVSARFWLIPLALFSYAQWYRANDSEPGSVRALVAWLAVCVCVAGRACSSGREAKSSEGG